MNLHEKCLILLVNIIILYFVYIPTPQIQSNISLDTVTEKH